MATMAAVEKMHAETHERQEPNEPVTNNDVSPMLGDEQESCDGNEADENYPDCRPPKRLWSGMFVVIHELSHPVVTDTGACRNEYGSPV